MIGRRKGEPSLSFFFLVVRPSSLRPLEEEEEEAGVFGEGGNTRITCVVRLSVEVSEGKRPTKKDREALPVTEGCLY